MTDLPVRVEQRGHVRWLHLNRPRQRNALDESILASLERQVDEIEADAATRVIVVAGDGKSFCAGGDFRQFLSAEGSPGGVVAFLARLSACLTRIENSSKPWIAALHGHAIAGGLEIALVCDVVIAAEGSLIGDGHLNNRLLPAAGSSVRLERAVGKSVARWMHLSGAPVLAEDLAATSWLHDVVAPGDLHFRAQEVAEQLASRDPRAQQNLKTLLTALEGLDSEAALALELEAFGSNWVGSDAADALREFLGEPRVPEASEVTAV